MKEKIKILSLFSFFIVYIGERSERNLLMKNQASELTDKEMELEIIIKQYSKLLYVVALSVLGRTAKKEDVEELVSDVFLRYWRHQNRYDPQKGSLKNYLVLLTKSMSINQLRKSSRNFLPLTDFPLEDLQAEAKRESDVWDMFFEALMLLDEPTREICLERYFYELKPKVIAQNLDLSVKEVKNRLYIGKKKIRKEMEYLMIEQGVKRK